MRREGSLGCLGCFSLFVMTGVTLAQLGFLVWLNPMWFDRVALWRGPRLPAEVALVVDPTARAEFDRRRAAATAKLENPDALALLPKFAVETTVTPDQGGRVEMIEGTRIDFPPGAVRASEKVAAFLDGKEIRQTIVVPGKLVNLVVG